MSVIDVLCGMLRHLLEPYILMVTKQFYKIRLPEVTEHVTVLMAVYNKAPISSLHHNYKQHITLLLWGCRVILDGVPGVVLRPVPDQYP